MIELGTYFAAPYGATLLTDLGARVIKIEQLDGDPIRHIIPFPEVGAVKVLQGKETVAVDIHTDAGREIVHELVRHADAVLVSFRAGVVERLGLDPASLLAVNPDLVYLSAPGYGVDGPCGHRPAFAPTIGAGSGLAMRNIGESAAQGPDLEVEVVKPTALRVASAAMGVGHADGFSALGVASALLLGLLARERGAPGQALQTSMLLSMAHVLVEDMVEYDDRPARLDDRPGAARALGALPPVRDRRRLGVPRRTRAVGVGRPRCRRWRPSSTSRPTRASPTRTPAVPTTTSSPISWRGCSASSRPATGRTSSAHVDVGCLAVRNGAPDAQLFADGGLGRQNGWVTDVEHPTIGTHPRLMPLVEFSRSSTVVKPSSLLRRAHRLGARASSATTPIASRRCVKRA